MVENPYRKGGASWLVAEVFAWKTAGGQHVTPDTLVLEVSMQGKRRHIRVVACEKVPRVMADMVKRGLAVKLPDKSWGRA